MLQIKQTGKSKTLGCNCDTW